MIVIEEDLDLIAGEDVILPLTVVLVPDITILLVILGTVHLQDILVDVIIAQDLVIILIQESKSVITATGNSFHSICVCFVFEHHYENILIIILFTVFRYFITFFVIRITRIRICLFELVNPFGIYINRCCQCYISHCLKT